MPNVFIFAAEAKLILHNYILHYCGQILGKKELIGGMIYSDFQARGCIPSWWEDIVADQEGRCKCRRMAGHIACAIRKQSVNRKWIQAIKPQGLPQ